MAVEEAQSLVNSDILLLNVAFNQLQNYWLMSGQDFENWATELQPNFNDMYDSFLELTPNVTQTYLN